MTAAEITPTDTPGSAPATPLSTAAVHARIAALCAETAAATSLRRQATEVSCALARRVHAALQTLDLAPVDVRLHTDGGIAFFFDLERPARIACFNTGGVILISPGRSGSADLVGISAPQLDTELGASLATFATQITGRPVSPEVAHVLNVAASVAKPRKVRPPQPTAAEIAERERAGTSPKGRAAARRATAEAEVKARTRATAAPRTEAARAPARKAAAPGARKAPKATRRRAD